MWKIDPKVLCRNHLLGEHLEMHMFHGCIKQGKKLEGYIRKGLVEIHCIKQRHDELCGEMRRRGYNHKSPLEGVDRLSFGGEVNVIESLADLLLRCPECRRRYEDNNRA